MRRFILSLAVTFFTTLLLGSSGIAQQAATTTVPNLVRYGGVLKDAQGAPLSSTTVGITFAIYKQQDGGAPVWMETQSVATDAGGNYSALLGSTTANGLPGDLFSQEEQRWLGVQVQGQAEQSRVLLVSVPYAFKAHEAETLGGKSVSDFVLANSTNSSANSSSTTQTGPNTANSPPASGGARKGAASAGPTNFSGSTTDQIVGVTQSGTGGGVIASAPSKALVGTATSTSGTAIGVEGGSNGSGGYGVYGNVTSATGATVGVKGNSQSSGGTGVRGTNIATSGATTGVSGYVDSAAGTAGSFNNAAGGMILSGQNNGVVKFSVDGSGNITSQGTLSGIGITGTTSAAAGVGLTGNATNTTGANTGVMGETPSTNGTGVGGYANATTGQNVGVYGQTNSNNGWGVYGEADSTSGQTFGVEGNNQSAGNYSSGVLGYENAATGAVYGVQGVTASTTNYAVGVVGNENAATGVVYGVQGVTASTTNNAAGVAGNENATSGVVYGVSGITNSATNGAAGVNGYEGAATGVVYGVNGNTNSTTTGAAAVSGVEGALTGTVSGVSGTTMSSGQGAAGVSGYAQATSGETYGVLGINSSSTNGANGVLGSATATTGQAIGVQGASSSPEGIGVEGINVVCSGSGCTLVAGTAGFFATATGGTILEGVGGTDTVFTVDSSGNGHYAGNLNVTGTLTKGGGSFKIDDPLDPENKTLSHSFVESPDMMNLYNGSVRLDARGEAWVAMPEYFQALNRDFQYVLTSVGSSQPRLYIAREMKGNRFKIAGGGPNGKVSWMVTGIRQDAWANAHRIPTEEEKPPQERGKYLHPELYGASADQNTNAMLRK
jgi:hypothetical protein